MDKNLERFMLENGETIFRKTKDGRSLRMAIWKIQKDRVCGTIFFLNGHREFIEKYSETFEWKMTEKSRTEKLKH